MNEIASAVSAASTTRSVMYVNTLKTCSSGFRASHWAASNSMACPLSRERVRDPLHAHEPRTLHEDRRAVRRFVHRSARERVGIVEVHGAPPESLHRVAARLARRHQRVDARLLRE